MTKRKKRHDIPESPGAEKRSDRQGARAPAVNALVFAVFVLCVIALYGGTLRNPFIWDDRYLIEENHLIKSFSYIPEIFKHHLYYGSAGISNFYRPLQTFFLMADYALWKNNAAGYHATSILFHLLCAFFAYLFIYTLLGRRIPAFLAGLLFLVHPANSIVVNYISSRADSQAVFFILVSLYLFLRYMREDYKPAFLAASLVASLFALLSKELGIVLPFLILAIAAVYFPKDTRALKAAIPFFAIAGIYSALRLTVLHFPASGAGPAPPLATRLLTSAEAFVRLMGLVFIPAKIHIEKSIPYSGGIFQASTILSLAVLLALGVFMYWIRRYSKATFFGLSWFFIGLAPMSNIMPINATMADHWLYLPSIGLFLALTAGASEIIDGLHDKARHIAGIAAVSGCVAAVLIFSGLTIRQAAIWRSPLEFYKYTLKFAKNSFRPHNELGIIYLDQQKYDEAISEFRAAVALNPRFDQAYNNLGIALDNRGDLEEAIEEYKEAVKINPDNPKTWNNLGNAYNKLGRFDEAISSYERAIRLTPDYIAAYNNLGVIYYKKGEHQKAREYWQRILKMDPANEQAVNNLKVLEEINAR